MAKKFAEHSGLNLTNVNKEILEMWNNSDVFHKSKMSVRAAHSSFSLKDHLQQTDILAFIMCWRAQSKTPSTATRQ